MGFSRQEYWSGLPFPSPGDLPNPGIEPASPALQVDSLPLSYQGIPNCIADQDKKHRWVWYYPWTWLVFCLFVMISPVLCLLDVLYFIHSLRGGSLFEGWAATLASMLLSELDESNCWFHDERPLSSSSGLHEKLSRLLWLSGDYWQWWERLTIFLSHVPICQKDPKRYCTTDCPRAPWTNWINAYHIWKSFYSLYLFPPFLSDVSSFNWQFYIILSPIWVCWLY